MAMNTNEQTGLFKKYLWLVVIATLLVGGSAYVWAKKSPTTYRTSISFAVNRINKQDTPEYQFDGYYAIQASDLFSQTVVSWFFTPSFILEVYDTAGVTPVIDTLEKFTGQFKTKKYSAQNIVVTYPERDRATAEKIASAIMINVAQRAQELNQSSDQKALFEVVGAKPVIVEQPANIATKTVLGLIVGLVAALGVIYLVRYFRG
jgi:capsular polysaccharide biosynthesis protein